MQLYEEDEKLQPLGVFLCIWKASETLQLWILIQETGDGQELSNFS